MAAKIKFSGRKVCICEVCISGILIAIMFPLSKGLISRTEKHWSDLFSLNADVEYSVTLSLLNQQLFMFQLQCLTREERIEMQS